jgi:NAD-dependent SIR2 family protein deacetylase
MSEARTLLDTCAECKGDFYGTHAPDCSREENLDMCGACESFYLNTTTHNC